MMKNIPFIANEWNDPQQISNSTNILGKVHVNTGYISDVWLSRSKDVLIVFVTEVFPLWAFFLELIYCDIYLM